MARPSTSRTKESSRSVPRRWRQRRARPMLLIGNNLPARAGLAGTPAGHRRSACRRTVGGRARPEVMMTARLRFLVASLAVTALLVGIGVAPAGPAQAAVDRPTKMASLGDSITRGFNACGFYFDCTARSWSTGSYSSVNSHYRRLAAVRSLAAYN